MNKSMFITIKHAIDVYKMCAYLVCRISYVENEMIFLRRKYQLETRNVIRIVRHS